MKTLLLTTMLAALGCSQYAMAGLIVDQQNTVSNSTFGPSTSPGQSFTPSLAGIDFATFSLLTSGTSSTLQVNLFSGSGYGGALLASTVSQIITNTSFQTIQFDFLSTVALTSGNPYTLQVQVLSGSGIFEQESSSNSYAGGDEYSSTGVAQTGFDMVFSEGTNSVPEPSTFALLGAGAFLLIGYKRLRNSVG